MTSPRPTEKPAPVDLTGLHDLLWQVRHDGQLANRMRNDPAGVCADFDIPTDVESHLVALDVGALLAAGTNPYLLFFAALELDVPRAEYYAQLTRSGDDG